MVTRPSLSAPIDVNAAGDNIVVPAVPGASIRVLNYLIIASAAVDAYWNDGVPLSGPLPLPDQAGVNFIGVNESPAFETERGTPLLLNLSDAIQVSGHLAYTLIF